MKKTILVLFFFLPFVLLNAQETESKELRQAPNFELEDIDGDFIELSEMVGDGPILVSFWATWCKPCIEELGYFKEIYEKYHAKGMQMLAISTDNEKTVAKEKPFVKTKNYPFRVLLDTNSEVSRLYYAQAVPFSVIIDKSGKVVFSHLGYKKGDELEVEEIIQKLLKE